MGLLGLLLFLFVVYWAWVSIRIAFRKAAVEAVWSVARKGARDPEENGPDAWKRYQVKESFVLDACVLEERDRQGNSVYDLCRGTRKSAVHFGPLTFATPCRVTILKKDGTLVLDRKGLVVKDRKGNTWESRTMKLDGEERILLLPPEDQPGNPQGRRPIRPAGLVRV
jgi:hypothetical protein